MKRKTTEAESGGRSPKKIDSLEGYEGKAAEKAKVVHDLLSDPQGGFTLKCLLEAVKLSKSTYMFHGRESQKEKSLAKALKSS